MSSSRRRAVEPETAAEAGFPVTVDMSRELGRYTGTLTLTTPGERVDTFDVTDGRTAANTRARLQILVAAGGRAMLEPDAAASDAANTEPDAASVTEPGAPATES